MPARILLGIGAEGGFSPAVYTALKADPALVNEISAVILEEHFPSEVIRLYEHRCAMCGFDGRLGSADLALEAAHIMWHALGGPDEPSNGLLLCSIHHKALDRGAVGLSEDRRILVSQDLHGGSQVSELIIQLSGHPVRPPIDPSASPGPRFMSWHRSQVFRSPPRPAA